MKTKNYFLSAALMLMFILTASFTSNRSEKEYAGNTNREKAKFTHAGYWIDAVVVSNSSTKSDEELLAGKGYFIEPVVVTFDADKAMMAGEGYYINTVVITYRPDTNEPMLAVNQMPL